MRARACDAPALFGPRAGRLARTIPPIRRLLCVASDPSRKSAPAHGHNRAPKPDHGDPAHAIVTLPSASRSTVTGAVRPATSTEPHIGAGCHAMTARFRRSATRSGQAGQAAMQAAAGRSGGEVSYEAGRGLKRKLQLCFQRENTVNFVIPGLTRIQPSQQPCMLCTPLDTGFRRYDVCTVYAVCAVYAP